jgi:hypothetical protein
MVNIEGNFQVTNNDELFEEGQILGNMYYFFMLNFDELSYK